MSSDEDEYGASIQQGKKRKNSQESFSDNESELGIDGDDDRQLTKRQKNMKGQMGMAGAMSRILGMSSASSTKSKPIVLSKTITPLQRQQKKEKSVEASLREKQTQRRRANLTSMHIPLSAATTRPLKNGNHDSLMGKAISEELEFERIHRRVATRGVVALFNAISKHQQERAQMAAEASLGSITNKNKNDVKKMSKHGFLDLIKKTGTDGDLESKENHNAETKISSSNGLNNTNKTKEENGKTKRWNALKDDFMMNPKLKDWDKELSDDDLSDDSLNDEN
mmetsp:Transcript_8287/g.11825  ORF Transcript_8287/g.11825 Transcript_8287/m.11825 type:complete len:281 (-) Transcript_8287:333-1175(-)